MNLDQFTVFATVAKHRNVTRASEKLRISQPAVTKQLRRLQQNYNAKFYTRGGKGIELTDSGELFLRRINKILKAVRKLDKDFHATFPEKETQSLRVAGTFAASATLLPQLLAVFKRAHPGVRLSLRTDNGKAIEGMLLKSEVDIAVFNQQPRSPQLAAEPFRREQQVAFALPNHPLARKRSVTARELSRAPLIVRNVTGGVSTSVKTLRQLEPRVKPNVVLQCETPGATKMAVRKNLGIGILIEGNVKSEIRNGDFKKLKLSGFKLKSPSYIIYPRNRPLSANAQEFLTLLRTKVTKDRNAA